ncbi:unnamed protein product [Arabidopsis thaliana]|uniref:(thale cress) hypothetical protein n=1 Tax=Arabidopsis thaliana TaxID=3702 RepID=A0A7G2EI22_ARATH|nr:unnamed protein product [Arabidopsis thaliana]
MKMHFFILLIITSWLSEKITSLPPDSRVFDRHGFPDNFVFGTAASAFQYEGATSEGGKSPSIWDYFSHTFPGGKVKDGVNKEGVEFYMALIDELVANAVGRCSKWVNSKCQGGDSGTEPYIASHHLLLAHAAAVQEFRKCNKTQDGQIGIVLSPLWFEPYDSASPADNEAVKRALATELDWHLDPVIHGDYPEMMKKLAGNRLPSFTPEQSKMLKNSSDFIGINYYTARYVAHIPQADPARPRFVTDHQLQWRVTNHSNHQFGPGEDRGILQSHPEGLRKVLNYIKDKYNNPIVYIKENGINDYDDGTKSREEILNDTFRISYHEDHLQQLQKAIIEDGCDVRGYYVWSLLDNFEWEHGYSTRFGVYYVDYDNDLTRIPKDSVNWFKQFLDVKNKEIWDVSHKERYNKTFDDSESFEASVGSILYLMTNNISRREEEERDQCAFGNLNDQSVSCLTYFSPATKPRVTSPCLHDENGYHKDDKDELFAEVIVNGHTDSEGGLWC